MLLAVAGGGGGCVLAALARSRRWPLSVMAELVAPAVIVLLLGLGLSIAAGKIAAAWFCGFHLAAGAAWLVVASRAGAARRAEGESRSFKIVHANLLDSARAAARVAAWGERLDCDVIALTELPAGALAALRPQFRAHPFAIESEDDGRRRVALLAKRPLEQRPSPDVNVLLALAEREHGPPILIACAHPSIPTTPRGEARRDEIILKAFTAAGGGTPAIVVGDLNTTPSGPVLSVATNRSGLRRAGHGFAPTWMAPVFGLGLTLDHIYVSSHFAVASCAVGPFIGSDHRPIAAEIAW